jgi:hypothetical protein
LNPEIIGLLTPALSSSEEEREKNSNWPTTGFVLALCGDFATLTLR